jgi:hypothetical protein
MKIKIINDTFLRGEPVKAGTILDADEVKTKFKNGQQDIENLLVSGNAVKDDLIEISITIDPEPPAGAASETSDTEEAKSSVDVKPEPTKKGTAK